MNYSEIGPLRGCPAELLFAELFLLLGHSGPAGFTCGGLLAVNSCAGDDSQYLALTAGAGAKIDIYVRVLLFKPGVHLRWGPQSPSIN